jgi:hypothetical protein
MPDDAKSREYPELLDLLGLKEAIEWIANSDGCSLKDAFFKLSDALSLGAVTAVNGYNEPLSRHLFPDRLVQNFEHYSKLKVSEPNSYAQKWQRPEREIHIRFCTLQKFRPSKSGINSEIALASQALPEHEPTMPPGEDRPTALAPQKLRKRRAPERDRVVAEMHASVEEGKRTYKKLCDENKESLAAEFRTKPTTAYEAQKIVRKHYEVTSRSSRSGWSP